MSIGKKQDLTLINCDAGISLLFVLFSMCWFSNLGDTVYHLSELRRLTAFHVRTGEERWHVDIMKTFKTGDKRWQTPGKGSLTYADGHLYCLKERGTMALVKATPEKWNQVSSFRLPRGGEGPYWAHPVVCGGRLYVRHSDQLYAYDIRKD